MSSLQEIRSVHREDYIRSKRLPTNIIRALSSIQYCKTASLGGHIYECDEYGETTIAYNSCRNRH